jgi:hypothetical protein
MAVMADRRSRAITRVRFANLRRVPKVPHGMFGTKSPYVGPGLSFSCCVIWRAPPRTKPQKDTLPVGHQRRSRPSPGADGPSRPVGISAGRVAAVVRFESRSGRKASALSNSTANLSQRLASILSTAFTWESAAFLANCVHRNACSRHSFGLPGMADLPAHNPHLQNELGHSSVPNGKGRQVGAPLMWHVGSR